MHSVAAATVDAICDGVCMQKSEEKILFAHFRGSFRGYFSPFSMTATDCVVADD